MESIKPSRTPVIKSKNSVVPVSHVTASRVCIQCFEKIQEALGDVTEIHDVLLKISK